MQVYEANYVLNLLKLNKELEEKNKILTDGVARLSKHLDELGDKVFKLLTILELEEKA